MTQQVLRQAEPSLGSPRLILTGRKEKSKAKTHLKTHQPLCIFLLGRVGKRASHLRWWWRGCVLPGTLKIPSHLQRPWLPQAAAWTLTTVGTGDSWAWEAKAAVSKIMPLHSSLGDEVRPCLKKEKRKNVRCFYKRLVLDSASLFSYPALRVLVTRPGLVTHASQHFGRLRRADHEVRSSRQAWPNASLLKIQKSAGHGGA